MSKTTVNLDDPKQWSSLLVFVAQRLCDIEWDLDDDEVVKLADILWTSAGQLDGIVYRLSKLNVLPVAPPSSSSRPVPPPSRKRVRESTLSDDDGASSEETETAPSFVQAIALLDPKGKEKKEVNVE